MNAVRDWFDYEDGKLFWKQQPSRGTKAGQRAGSRNKDGYWQVTWQSGKRWKVHRLVWEWHNGPIPPGLEVDHINDDREDNRIENLQLLTKLENNLKARDKQRKRPGLRGTYRRKNGRWSAKAVINGRQVPLGTYDTTEEAHAAYLTAVA
jgi:hypothetical protein